MTDVPVREVSRLILPFSDWTSSAAEARPEPSPLMSSGRIRVENSRVKSKRDRSASARSPVANPDVSARWRTSSQSMPLPSSLTHDGQEVFFYLGSQQQGRRGGLAGGGTLGGQFDAVIHGVHDEMAEGFTQGVDDLTVHLDVVSYDFEPDLLARSSSEESHQLRERAGHFDERR